MLYLNKVHEIYKFSKLFTISININYKLFNILLKLRNKINKFFKLFKILNKHKCQKSK